jgi:opacity protein-like surface antigen
VTGVLTTDVGYGLNGAVGYRFGIGLRGDFEYAYRRNEIDTLTVNVLGQSITGYVSGRLAVVSTLVNGYYDFTFDRDLFVPYIGGGVGVAFINLEEDSTGFDATETVFAYQLAAGTKIPISNKVSARIGYKFFATSNPQFDLVEGEYMAHNFELGVVYDF